MGEKNILGMNVSKSPSKTKREGDENMKTTVHLNDCFFFLNLEKKIDKKKRKK